LTLTAVNALGQVQQGKTARAQANIQAGLSEYQAQVEQDNALKMAEIIRRAGRKQVGQANAAFAGAGVKVGEGSAAEVERDITQGYEQDAFQAILEGNRRARGLQTDAAMERAQGRMAQAAGYVNAVGTVLGGAYQGMKSNGWRTGGPGFSGQQAPAPVVDKSIRVG
jgi:hypothetical protein